MRIGLFITCLADMLYPQAGQATVEVLERLGVTVTFPPEQTCCGQMHINTGYQHQAIPLLRHQIDSFRDVDWVVAPSASCVGAVRHQYASVARVAGDLDLAEQAAELAARTYELSEFLVDVLGVTDVGAYYPHRVTFHPTCHSLRLLRSADKSLALLRAVRGLSLIELADAEQCCGFGGTFALKHANISTAMMADKVSHVVQTGAELVTAADASCLMHIGGGLSRLRTGTRTVHLAEILASRESS